MIQDAKWKHEQWLKAQEFMDPELCIGWNDTTCNASEAEHDMINILHKFNKHSNAPKKVINIFQFIGLEILAFIAAPIIILIGVFYNGGILFFNPKVDLILIGIGIILIFIILNIFIFKEYIIKNPLKH